MKSVLLMSAIAFFSMSAQAEVKLVSSDQNGIAIRVTGKDVKTLKEILEYGSLDNVAATNDYSTIRSLSCDKDSCTIVTRGDLKTSADAADYYTNDLNKTLGSLKDNQVLLLAPGIGAGNNGTIDEMDGRVTRALMNAQLSEGVKVKMERNLRTKLKADQGSLLVLTAAAELSEIKIKCYTSLELEMGIQNFAQNNCSLEAIVNK